MKQLVNYLKINKIKRPQCRQFNLLKILFYTQRRLHLETFYCLGIVVFSKTCNTFYVASQDQIATRETVNHPCCFRNTIRHYQKQLMIARKWYYLLMDSWPQSTFLIWNSPVVLFCIFLYTHCELPHTRLRRAWKTECLV